MSERKPSVLVKDILNSIDRISVYSKDLSYNTFVDNYMIVEACLYNIQIIGEVVSKLPDDIKTTEPQIPWALIKGMRNRLIHEYFGTDTAIVWKVIKNELPNLVKELERIYVTLMGENR